MSRRVPMIAVLAALVFSGVLSAPASADTPLPPLPSTMAAVGDSISQAASTGGSLGTDYPQNSWSTGTNSTVNSHYLRLLARGALISGQNNNLSVSGAKAAGLNAQMVNVGVIDPAYLTVQIGGNDLCTNTFAGMTSVDDFRAQFATAMATLASVSPATHVYVVSIPDAYQLWSLFKNNGWARFIWSLGGVCQSLLANPTSTQQVDVDRRLAVQQRNIDYNLKLADVCGLYPNNCHFDGNAIFNTKFLTSDIAGDYFHPSIAGQAKLASVSWAVGYAWATSPPSNVAPIASFTSTCSDLTCTFTDTSSDSDGSIATRAWAFGDSSSSSASNPVHTYAAGGSYNIGLTVTDNLGATGFASATVTVAAPPAPKLMLVGGLTSTTTTTSRNWRAVVTVVVVDQQGGPVEGVSVTGAWSVGTGGTSCTTTASGSCVVTSSSLSKKSVPSVTYTVTGLAKSGWVRDVSQGTTSIVVTKP